jgi:EmrB/QacA subfamily drug resistance transporter
VTGARERPGKGNWLALSALCAGVFLVANDFTGLSVAIPRIEADFDTEITTAQWVINSYSLVFGVLIVTAGRLADLFGRKRLFLVGAGAFALFALLSGVAPSIDLLIVFRGLMGIGGALMWPALLGMIYAILPGRAGLAGGLILGVAGLGNAVGPVLGGALTDALSWRWVFLVNLPAAALAMAVVYRQVRESGGEAGTRAVDWRGIAALSLATVALLLAFDEGTGGDFLSPEIVALFAFAAIMFSAFALIESRQGASALVPREVFASRVFSGSAAAAITMAAIFSGALVYLPQFMTKDLGWSAIESGLGLLPVMGVFALTSFAAGPLYDRLGRGPMLCLGAACLGAGILILSFLDGGSSFGSLVPGMVVLGIGMGLFYPSVTTAAVTALDPSQASLAGGIVYMCQVAGGAIGLGLNTAIVASADSLTEGISHAFRVDAALALVGLLICLGIARQGRPAPRSPDELAPATGG